MEESYPVLVPFRVGGIENFSSLLPMENTLTVYVASLNEHWEMPDRLALNWGEYEKDHPVAGDNHNADTIHLDWFNTLTQEEQGQITRKKAEE